MADPNSNFYAAIPDGPPATKTVMGTKVARYLFRAFGWRFEGKIPDVKKAVVVIAPHTSNIDFLILVLAKYSLRIGASYMMKKEAFVWPLKKWFIGIGGIPIDRSQPTRIVSQVTKQIRDHDKMWFVITPEGTRKKVHKYKTGFARIAHAANVPIVLIGFNYKKKAIVFDQVRMPSGNHEQDAEELREYCRGNFVGRHPDNQ